jgi:hypothetical protein
MVNRMLPSSIGFWWTLHVMLAANPREGAGGGETGEVRLNGKPCVYSAGPGRDSADPIEGYRHV